MTEHRGDGEPVTGPGADPTEVEEIEAERARRLAPENRPEGAVVDNTGDNAPDLDAVDPAAGDDQADREGTAGTSDPTARFRDIEVSEEERREIEAERTRRLAPENRPDGTEVDNT